MSGADKANAYIGFGNGSNFASAIYAKRMGAPIEIIAAISNENRVFPDFMETGEYKPRKTVGCHSSAMDVGNPSNIIRVFDMYNGNVDRSGVVHKRPNMKEMKKELRTAWVTNEEIETAIKHNYERFKDEHGVRAALDPHGANANWGMHKLRDSDKSLSRYPAVFTETASPTKFPDLIRKLLGFDPPLPDHLKDIYERKERVFEMEPDLSKIEEKVYELLSI